MSIISIQPTEGQSKKLEAGPFPVSLRLGPEQLAGDWQVAVIQRDAKRVMKSLGNGKGATISVLRVESVGTGFFKRIAKKVKRVAKKTVKATARVGEAVGKEIVKEAIPTVQRIVEKEVVGAIPGGEETIRVATLLGKAAVEAAKDDEKGKGVMMIVPDTSQRSVVPIGSPKGGKIMEVRLKNLEKARAAKKKRGKGKK